jgi:hypothetical protein
MMITSGLVSFKCCDTNRVGKSFIQLSSSIKHEGEICIQFLIFAMKHGDVYGNIHSIGLTHTI